MRGELPVWLFVVCLAVAVPAAFAAGFHWTKLARRLRLRRQVRAALARLDVREQQEWARSGETVDTTRFTR